MNTILPLPLCNDHLNSLLQLSKQANWNQTRDDWRYLLKQGCGWGISNGGTTAGIVASIIVLPYPPECSWISMVLVDAEHRRQGYATALMDVAIDYIVRHKLTPLLDATSGGQKVYQRMGFEHCWSYTRYQRLQCDKTIVQRMAPHSSQKQPHVRALSTYDWPAVIALDKLAFGASREPLLQHLFERSPHSARVAELSGKLTGFILGRDGDRAHYFGPLVSLDIQSATLLLGAVLSSCDEPVYIDLRDVHTDIAQWLAGIGFSRQRGFSRMAYQRDSAPGTDALSVLLAGPELG